MAPLVIEKSIIVNSPVSHLWKVLTKPEYTKEYMFGSEVYSDWEEGSKIEWKGFQDLKETVFVKGIIIKINPEKYLSYTTFDPQGGLPDIPENYLQVSYDLKPKGDQVLLTISQGDFSQVAEGEERFKDSEQGWEATLPEIKRIAETIDEC